MYKPKKSFSSIYFRTTLGSEKSESLGKVESLVSLNNSYSRKRGAVHFNYCTDTPRRYDMSSPFHLLIGQLSLGFNGLLKGQSSTSFVEFHCLLTTMNRISNERVNKLYNNNSRDEGIHVLFINSLFLYQELINYRSVLLTLTHNVQDNLSSSSKSNGLQRLHALLLFSSSQFIPSLLVRVRRVMSLVIAKSSRTGLSLVFVDTNYSHFLGYYNSTKKQHGCLSGCTSDAVDPSTGRHEVTVAEAVKLAVDDSVNKVLIESIQEYVSLCIEINSLYGNSDAQRDVLHCLLTVILNGSLQTLLDEMLRCKQLIDESGVYKLYRIILKHQEFIVALKKHLLTSTKTSLRSDAMNSGSSRSVSSAGGMLIQDLRVWKKSEFVLELLNKSIFARKQSGSGASTSSSTSASQSRSESGSQFNILRSFRSRTSPGANAAATTTTVFNINTLAIHSEYISLDEQKQWIELTDNELTQPDSAMWIWLGMKGTKAARWKHRGTVNIALTVPTTDL